MTSAERTAEQLRLVAGTLMRRLRSESPGAPCSRPLHSVLVRLDRDGAATTAELARAEVMTPQTMGGFVAELEALGLVSRADDPRDGRRRLVSLTRAGARALAEGRALRQSWLARAIDARLDPSEQRTLAAAVELLRRIAES